MKDLVIDVHTKYVLHLRSKFTIISGKSASGKSSMLKELIEVPEWSNAYPDIIVLEQGDTSLVLDAKLSAASAESVVIVDEDSIKNLRRTGRLTRLNTLNCHSIVFSHNALFDLMYSYEDVYYLAPEGDCVTNKRLYTDYTKLPNADVYFTEDSASGFEYYNTHLSGDVKPAIDNVHFTDCVDNGTIIADGAVLGPQVTQWAKQGVSVSLFAPVSFEYLIERYYDNYYKHDFMDRVPLYFKSLERYFTSLVKQRFPDYDKSHCPKEVLDIDLLQDFKCDGSVFNGYCERYNIQDRDAEYKRLCSVYGTTDFSAYLREDFNL